MARRPELRRAAAGVLRRVEPELRAQVLSQALEVGDGLAWRWMGMDGVGASVRSFDEFDGGGFHILFLRVAPGS